MSKKLINTADSCVEDAVEGILLTDSRLRRVGNLNILVRADIAIVKDSYVTVLSGGGSGHEPAHAGFIGEGMLSCAVLGNVFASPSVASILAAIRATAGKRGVLLVVKNYTGDRLNFGMAMELAKQEGIQAKMVIVADDCALPSNKGITGGRGIAGTVFIHKIAGAAAASGKSLDEVHSIAETACKSIGSMGVALTTCTVPGAAFSVSRLADAELMEVGMGIHGEPGREQMKLPREGAATFVARLLVEGILGTAPELTVAVCGSAPPLQARMQYCTGQRIAVLINNLGAVPVIETLIVAKEVMVELRGRGLVPVRSFVGQYMTSLEMCGVSLSLLMLNEDNGSYDWLSDIDYPTTAPAWLKSSDLSNANTAELSLPIPSNRHGADTLSGKHCDCGVLEIVKEICDRLIDLEPMLTKYDEKCGDGDCGLVMKKGAQRVSSVLPAFEADLPSGAKTIDAAKLFSLLADSVSASMGGTSGALLELCFRSMATSFSVVVDNVAASESSPVMPPSPPMEAMADTSTWIAAFTAGVEAIKYYGGADKGMRTMLDAFIPALEALQSGGTIKNAAAAASAGMHATKTMEGLAGRSNYVDQSLMKGVPDPGAAAVSAAISILSDKLG